MSNIKRNIFIGVFILFICFIASKYLLDKIKKDNPTLMNTAEEIAINKGDYIVGEDLEPGFYDVEVLDEDVVFMSVKLTKGDKLVGIYLNKSSHVIIEGNGKIKLSPGTYDTLSLNVNNEYIINNSGYYMIGQQIPPGKYKIIYEVDSVKEKQFQPFVQLLPGYGEDALNAIHFKKNKSYNLELKTGNVLEVHKSLMEEYDEVIIKLLPLS